MKKRLISLLLTLVMLFSLCSVFAVSASADAQVATVTLASGDTVLGICQKYGIDYYAYKNLIMKLNGLTDESQFRKLAVGSKVVLPISNTAAAALSGGTAAGTTVGTVGAPTTGAGVTAGTVNNLPSGDHVAYYLVTYTVQRGETIGGIYANMGLSYKTYANQIVKLNNLANINAVQAGKTLILPTTSPSLPNTTYTTVMAHTIRAGDSAYNIVCSDYGLNYNSAERMLRALNNRDNLNLFRVGETMYIPVAGVVTANTVVNNGGTTTTGTVSTSGNYNLVSQTPTNGSFDLQVNGKSVKAAAAGQLVSVVCTPDTGYAVESVKVVKVGDAATAVAVTNSSFVMPSYSVTVSVTFKQAKQSEITLAPVANGSVSAMVDNTIVNKAYAGTQVTIKTTPATGFMLDYVRVTYNENRDSIAVSGNKFTMPNFPVTISAVFKVDPDFDPSKGNAIFFDVQNATVTAKVGTESVTAAKQGERITLSVSPKENYTLESIKVYYDNFKKTAELDKMSFTMPGEPVTVVAVVKPTAQASFNITKVDNTDGSFKVLVDGKEASSAKTGQTVKVEATSNKAYYNYLTYVTKTGDSSVAVQVAKDGTFTMPDYPVTIRVKFYVYHNVVIDASNGSNGYYNVSSVLTGAQVSRCGAGVELRVNVWGVKNGYAQSNVILTYADGSTYTLDGNTFIMPDCDVRVRVNFTSTAKLVAKSIGAQTHPNYPNQGNTYTVMGKTLNDKAFNSIELWPGVGNYVIVNPQPTVGYEVDENMTYYEIDNDPTKRFFITKDALSGRYQFQMPGTAKSRVDLYVGFKAIDTWDVEIVGLDSAKGQIELMTSLGYVDKVAKDSVVWVRVYPSANYRFDPSKLVIKTVSGQIIDYNSFDSTFRMPGEDVVIDASACFTASSNQIRVITNWLDAAGGSRGNIKIAVGDTIYEDFSQTIGSNESIVMDNKGEIKLFKEGTIVRVIHEAKEGYILSSIAVKTASGADVPTSSVSNSEFTFVMPAEPVTITPVYDNDYYALVAEPSANGTFKVPAQAQFGKGAPVTEIVPASGFAVEKVTFTYTDGNGVEQTEEAKISDGGQYIVNPSHLPKSEVKVSVVFAAQKYPYTIVTEFTPEAVKNPNLNYVVELYVGDVRVAAGEGIEAGKTVVIRKPSTNGDENLVIDKIWVMNNGGQPEYLNKDKDGNFYFTMPGNACEIHVLYGTKESSVGSYNVVLNLTGAYSKNESSPVPVKLGAPITVSLTPLPGYAFQTDPTAQIAYTDSTGTSKTESATGAPNADGSYTFTFPAIPATPMGDVSFTCAATDKIAYQITSGDSGVTFTVDGAAAGTPATASIGNKVTVAGPADKTIVSVEVKASSGEAVAVSNENGVYSFTMPADSVDVKVTFEPEKLTVNPVAKAETALPEGVTVNAPKLYKGEVKDENLIADGAKLDPGEKITIVRHPAPEGYTSAVTWRWELSGSETDTEKKAEYDNAADNHFITLPKLEDKPENATGKLIITVTYTEKTPDPAASPSTTSLLNEADTALTNPNTVTAPQGAPTLPAPEETPGTGEVSADTLTLF